MEEEPILCKKELHLVYVLVKCFSMLHNTVFCEYNYIFTDSTLYE